MKIWDLAKRWLDTFKPNTILAKTEMDKFNVRYKRYLNQINKISLTVLVWGPSLKTDGIVAHKRKEIRQALELQGYNAIFTEYLPRTAKSVSLQFEEFSQALAAHLIVILVEDAQGAIAEVHDFCTHPDIAWKSFVLAPLRYKDGYSGATTFYLLEKGYGGMYWYEENEIVNCNVLNETLLRAQARREIYAIHMRQRGTQP